MSWQYLWGHMVSGALDAHVENHKFPPYLSTRLNFDIAPKLMAQFQVEGMELSNNGILDTQVSMRNKLSPQWDVGIGVRGFLCELITSELTNELKGTGYFLTMAHSF